MRLASASCAALAACAGPTQQSSPRDDGGARATQGDAGEPEATPAAPPEPTSADGTRGTVVVKVEWPNAPAAVRASPGRNACGAPRRPPAIVHTLHGIAEAVVLVDSGTPAPVPRGLSTPARVDLIVRDCRIEPRVVVAPRVGVDLTIASADLRRHDVTVSRAGDPARLTTTAPEPWAAAALPVIGHEVAVLVDVPGIFRVAAAADPDDPAWVVVPTQRHVAITDETGSARLRDVPAGTYTVVAWAPGLSRRVEGQIAVEAGKTAELSLRLER